MNTKAIVDFYLKIETFELELLIFGRTHDRKIKLGVKISPSLSDVSKSKKLLIEHIRSTAYEVSQKFVSDVYKVRTNDIHILEKECTDELIVMEFDKP